MTWTWTWGRWTQYEFVKSRHCHWKCNKNIRFIFWYFSKLLKYLQFRFSLIDNQFQHWPNRFQHVSVTLLAHYNTPGIPRCASHYIALQYPCCASHVHLFWQKPAITFPLSHPLSERASPFQHHLFSSHDMPQMIMSKRFKTRLKIFRKSIQHTSQKRKKLAELLFSSEKCCLHTSKKLESLESRQFWGFSTKF